MDLDAFVGFGEINSVIFGAIPVTFFPSRSITPKDSESYWSKSSGKIWNSASNSSCSCFGNAEISAALSSLNMICVHWLMLQIPLLVRFLIPCAVPTKCKPGAPARQCA